MPKIKVKRKSTFIDMTAMSDVTVLLLTFFMLTSTFVQKEPVQVATPASVSEIKIPETNIFMSLDNQDNRVDVLQNVGREYGIEFTPEEINKFKLMNSFGVPLAQMKSFLALPTDRQDAILKDYGIPIDTTANPSNEFKAWVKTARNVNGDLRIAIKADRTTPYSRIKEIMSSLQDIRENRYNLITTLKSIPADN